MDINRDLYLSPVHKKDTIKLSAMTDSFQWNDKHDILVSIADGRLHTWYYPNAIYVDKDLMDLCKFSKVNYYLINLIFQGISRNRQNVSNAQFLRLIGHIEKKGWRINYTFSLPLSKHPFLLL